MDDAFWRSSKGVIGEFSLFRIEERRGKKGKEISGAQPLSSLRRIRAIPPTPRGFGRAGCLAIYAKWYAAPRGGCQFDPTV